METIKFKDGSTHRYPVQENDINKFYNCGTYSEAEELKKELGKGEVDFYRYGWFVRVRKVL